MRPGTVFPDSLRFAILFLATLLVASSAPAANSGDCVRGVPSAPIKIEVFSDFQCPACRAFYLSTMSIVMSEYADAGKACIVYREFPLSIHNHARQAAQFGHAAMKVGVRQWNQVTDALFKAQDAWAASGNIESVVANVLAKADLEALHKELRNTAALDAAIDADIQLGMQRGVNSTPTFFVTAGGRTEKIAAAVSYPILKRYLDSLLAKGN
ncbi:MAG TPA: thioredoxin domain-containing protein [Terriglobia bacterium]|nr:thioredoxin domain-containing protein [Terriglobia bacterium]